MIHPTTREREARDRVDLRKLQLCSAALAYADEVSTDDLALAAARYAEAVRALRDVQNREVAA